MRQSLISIILAASTIYAGNAAADTSPTTIPELEWTTSINHFQVDSDKFIGQRLQLQCPEQSVGEALGAVSGTDIYPSDSPICVAAVHAGVVETTGGHITVQINPGEEAYTGLLRNGIASTDRPATERSISFISGPSAYAEAIHIDYMPRVDWDMKFTRTGLANRDLVGQHFAFDCPAAPADMMARRVVGTDTYAFDSMICRAAVHSGQITLAGGPVVLQMQPGSIKLQGSNRNGIETKNGSSGVRSLVFVDTSGQ